MKPPVNKSLSDIIQIRLALGSGELVSLKRAFRGTSVKISVSKSKTFDVSFKDSNSYRVSLTGESSEVGTFLGLAIAYAASDGYYTGITNKARPPVINRKQHKFSR